MTIFVKILRFIYSTIQNHLENRNWKRVTKNRMILWKKGNTSTGNRKEKFPSVCTWKSCERLQNCNKTFTSSYECRSSFLQSKETYIPLLFGSFSMKFWVTLRRDHNCCIFLFESPLIFGRVPLCVAFFQPFLDWTWFNLLWSSNTHRNY